MGRPLFEGFLGTLKLSDSLHPCITVVPRGCTVRASRSLVRSDAGPPGFRTPCFGACQRSPTPPGASTPCHDGVSAVAFRVFGARRHPGLARFRGSILCLHLPLSTLRQRRYQRLRMTRGQCGWLDLHCLGLSPFTTVPAYPGACPNARPGPLAHVVQAALARDKRRACGVSSAGPRPAETLWAGGTRRPLTRMGAHHTPHRGPSKPEHPAFCCTHHPPGAARPSSPCGSAARLPCTRDRSDLFGSPLSLMG